MSSTFLYNPPQWPRPVLCCGFVKPSDESASTTSRHGRPFRLVDPRMTPLSRRGQQLRSRMRSDGFQHTATTQLIETRRVSFTCSTQRSQQPTYPAGIAADQVTKLIDTMSGFSARVTPQQERAAACRTVIDRGKGDNDTSWCTEGL